MPNTAPILMAALAGVYLAVSPQETEPDHLHTAGVAAHLQRCLDEAAQYYDAALALVPPTVPTVKQRDRVLRLAPRVFVNQDEHFTLKDVAAIHHPTERVIAYHFFWDDDVDFPDDNDPSDHEVAWVRYGADDRIVGASTLFHGRVLNMREEVVDSTQKVDGRPRIDVQWGKHGPMPAGWATLPIATEDSDRESGIPDGQVITLLEYNRFSWRKLSREGTRRREHPLASRYGWPSTFEGDFAAFTTFSRELDVLDLLKRRELMLVSRWNNGPLARWLLLYNFRPKLEWPEP